MIIMHPIDWASFSHTTTVGQRGNFNWSLARIAPSRGVFLHCSAEAQMKFGRSIQDDKSESFKKAVQSAAAAAAALI